jgi:signal transduction histidine kinase
MIRRVLVNLLENAIKFSKSGSQVEIGASRSGKTVEFWVRDQGPGIPQADRGRIFEKFARLAPGAPTDGLGLGLTFCQMAVHAHGGRIRVESAEGSGSRFVVELPARATGD